MKDSCISVTDTLANAAASVPPVASSPDTAAVIEAVTVMAAESVPAGEDNSIGRGVELMVIGMLTVFTILLIVINLGKLLIKVVNAIAPEEQPAPKKAAKTTPAAIDAHTMAILEQAVNQITGAKGHVASARKL